LPASPHDGVQLMTPVALLNVAPAGRPEEIDQTSGVPTQGVVVADGVIVSSEFSTTFWGVVIAATVTVPARCVTLMWNALLLPVSLVDECAVNVNGPLLPTVPHAGVQVITPVALLNDAPLGSAGLIDQLLIGPAQALTDADGVIVSVAFSTTVCGSAIAATVTVPARWVTSIANALLDPDSPVGEVAVSVNGP
jgi:hypothetical protein